MTRARSPSCHSISVKWQQLSSGAPEPLQAPAQVQALFHNDRLLVYGLIPHCTQVRRRPLCFPVGRMRCLASDFSFCFSPLLLPWIVRYWQAFSVREYRGWLTRAFNFSWKERQTRWAKCCGVEKLTRIVFSISGNSVCINSRQSIFYSGVNYWTTEDNWNCKIQIECSLGFLYCCCFSVLTFPHNEDTSVSNVAVLHLGSWV